LGDGVATETRDYELRLILDGLYYIEAKQTCSELVSADTQYAETERWLKETDREIAEISK
jgi:hypothetical protein